MTAACGKAGPQLHHLAVEDVDVTDAKTLPDTAEVLELILDTLPVAAIGRFQRASTTIRAIARGARPQVLLRRGIDQSWSWRKAHAYEVALFMDMLGVGPRQWAPGPNETVECNVMEQGSEAGSTWLWISGGTDWQGFQGGFRCISEAGVRPTWVTFRIRIQTPALSGAFLALSPAQHTWGLADPILNFNYSGDERASQKRCFVIQTGSTQNGNKSYACRVQPEIVVDQPYEVAVHLDWSRSVMSLFIDGERHVDCAPFRASQPVRFAALYNWRSGARTAFSELMLGDICPHAACDASGASIQPGRAGRLQCQCRKRYSMPKAASSNFMPAAWMLTSAAVAIFALALQQTCLQ
jgi:hypothetical protein